MKHFKYYFAAAVSSLTFAIYLPSLHNQFLWWDDNEYVFENPHITSLNADFFRWAFLDFYSNNWHPLTWISHALDYAVFGLDPMGHHLINNILHAANTFLTVLLVVRLIETLLSRQSLPAERPEAVIQMPENPTTSRFALITAGMTGLLFGLHPLHVQSVAWVSERKDLLCAFFFLAGMIAYVKYAGPVPLLSAATRHAAGRGGGTGKGSGQAGITQLPEMSSRIFNVYYLLCLALFTLALLSKPMAVSLPLVLLLLDWYPFERIRTLRTFASAVVEKIPFFALSIASSFLTIKAQESGGALSLNENLSFSMKLLVSAESLVAYLRKVAAPLDLMPYYPYPAEISVSSLRYLLPVILITGATAAVIATAKKYKFLAAASCYYLVTLFPVLGIVQVGHQAMADRYMYLPSIGPFILIGLLTGYIDRKVIDSKRPGAALTGAGMAVVIALLGCLSYITVQQLAIWKDDTTLWSYAIERDPTLALAYLNRGVAFEKAGDPDRAIADYSQVIALEPFRHYAAYYNRAHTFYMKGMRDEALRDYSTAILLDPDYPAAYYNRGMIYFDQNNDLAIQDFKKTCDLGEQKGCAALQMLPHYQGID